ncbi:MAG: hypothetical protein A2W91_00880 [Bacteroidetes bacterium GWF2_38_335]|nr:MAG: hypothetical protein A2W91_00880 [Bacteroidetes bacterium GWF2_38_335]OFY80309.1 MAG: hypothetical protein A2281_17390 [Bacteroidetes bacterium RIFOXYA12_FULL_38_20]HBS88891.1 hypothetical protein [Bacteroidales bacterium]
MKRLFLFLLIIPFFQLSYAQEENDTLYEEDNLLFQGNAKISGFGGPLINFTKINGDFSFMMGGGGGILFNDNLFFGGYGMGNSNKLEIDSSVYAGNYLGFANGGLWAGYVFMNKKKVHPCITLMLGWGNVTIANELGYIQKLDNIYVITPGLDIEYSIASFLKITAGVYYRKVSGISEIDFTDDNFSDLSVQITFKFGYFNAPNEDEVPAEEPTGN